MHVEVRMPYNGDMTLDATASDFDISQIKAYDASGVLLTDADASPSKLTVHDLLHAGDYSFVIEGYGVSTGTFDIVIECSSDAPTISPTVNRSRQYLHTPPFRRDRSCSVRAEEGAIDRSRPWPVRGWLPGAAR